MADFLAEGMDAFAGAEDPLNNFIDEEDDESTDQDKVVDKELKNDKSVEKTDEDADADYDIDLEEEDIDKKDGSSQENTSTQYSAFISALSEDLPFLADDKMDVKDASEMQEYISNKIETEVKSREFSDLTESQIKYLEGLRTGIPDADIKQNLSAEEQINSITEESLESDEKLRENIIYQAYLQDGLSEAKSRKLTRMSIDSGDDIEDAKESLTQLKEGVAKTLEAQKATAIKKQEDDQKAFDSQMKKLKDSIDEPEKVLGTKTLTKKYKDELYGLITKPQDYNGKSVNFLNKYLLENPVEANIVLAHLYKSTDGFKPGKISGLNIKAVKSKAAQDLSKLVEKGNWMGSDNQDNDLSIFDNTGFDDFKNEKGLF